MVQRKVASNVVRSSPAAPAAGLRPFATATNPEEVVQDVFLLAMCFSGLRSPWDATHVAPVCRAWSSFLNGNTEFWADFAPQEGQLAVLCRYLPFAGHRLRRLNLSGVRARLGPAVLDLQAGLALCPNLEDLNLAGCYELSFSSQVHAILRRSLRRLNVRGCSSLQRELLFMTGPALRELQAGWLSEQAVCRDQESWDEWVGVCPRHLFRHLCNTCPQLRVLRVPGYLPFGAATLETDLPAIMSGHVDLARVAEHTGLRRLDLCCAQGLDDNAVLRIAANCRRLRSLNLRACMELTDRALDAVTRSLAPALVHVNISCGGFSDAAVRRLAAAGPRLKTLDLCYCTMLGRGFVNYLCDDPALCPRLEMLGAGGLDVGDKELAKVCAKYAHCLTHLGIGSATRVTDEGVRELLRLERLQKLSAHELAGISPSAFVQLLERSRTLRAVDVDKCVFAVAPVEESLELSNLLDERRYFYDESDPETDVE